MQFGNPIGFEFRRTVTSGIISAKNRTIKIEEESKSSYMTDLIQTDATINPGNSGGPLIYPNGDIIGINTVKISTAEGIGFAIPINIIRPIIESFKQIGNFEEATIGIYAYDKEVPKSKKAILHYRLIGKSDNYFLLEVDLKTGRHHQIRCQLAKMGCPIKGDLKYGFARSNPDGSICLHARHISFVHPVSKEMIEVEAPVPPTNLWQGFKMI